MMIGEIGQTSDVAGPDPIPSFISVIIAEVTDWVPSSRGGAVCCMLCRRHDVHIPIVDLKASNHQVPLNNVTLLQQLSNIGIHTTFTCFGSHTLTLVN